MEPKTSMRIRARRFFTDLIELVAFGIIAITATLSLVNAVATLR